MHCKMLSAIFFNVDQSKILSSGNGLTTCSNIQEKVLIENDRPQTDTSNTISIHGYS